MAKATSSRTASADKRDIFLKSVLRASASAFVVAGVTFAPLAHAQDSGPQSDDPEVGADPAPVSDDVIVVTGIRRSLANAQNIKRDSDTVVDAITAEDIGALPDRSVTEALQRVPGVSINRFAGSSDPDHFSAEGSGVVVRGLNFVRSEFNGRTAFGAGVGGQALNFADVPSELLGSVVVSKNATADMIEGGLAGTVNLITRKPFDRNNDEWNIAFGAEANYGDFSDKWTPTFSGLVSKSWTTDAGRFGILVSGAFSQIKTRADGLQVANYQTRDGTSVGFAEGDGVTVCRNPLPSGSDNSTLPPAQADGQCGDFGTPGADGFADYADYRVAPVGGQFRTQEFNRKREGFSASAQWESLDERTRLTAEYIRSYTTNNWGEYTYEVAPDLSEYNTYPIGCLQNTNGPQRRDANGDPLPDTSGARAECPVGEFTDFIYDENGLFQSGYIVNAATGWRGNDPVNTTPFTPTGGLQHSLVRRQVRDQTLNQDFSINLTSRLTDRLSIELDAQYAKSRKENLDFSVIGSLFADQELDLTGDYPVITPHIPQFLGYSWDDNTISPELAEARDNGTYFTDPRFQFWRAAMDHIEDSTGEQYAFSADLEYEFDEDAFIRRANFGARWQDRDQTVRYSEYNWGMLSEVWSGSRPVNFGDTDGLSERYEFPDFFRGEVPGPPGAFYYGGDLIEDYEQAVDDLRGIQGIATGFGASPTWNPLAGRGGTIVPGTPYLDTEIQPISQTDGAAYAMLSFGSDNMFGDVRMSGNIGVRYVTTNLRSEGVIGIPDAAELDLATRDPATNELVYTDFATRCPAPTVPGAPGPGGICNIGEAAYNNLQQFAGNGVRNFDAAKFDYDYWLPSMNLKFGLAEDVIFRLAASKVLTRPENSYIRNFLTTGLDTEGNLTANAGNPFLVPATAWQFDASIEWYFDTVGSITLNGFYKTIDNFFYQQISERELTNNGVTQSVKVRGPANYEESGKIKGFEVAYQQTYDFLPGPFDGLGVQANYTFIQSEGLPNTFLNTGAPVDESTIPPGNLPLEQLSKHNFNLTGFYEKGPISLRAAYSWRSRFLLTAADVIFPYYSIFNEPTGQLDASVFFNLGSAMGLPGDLRVGVQGVNLTNEVTRTTQAYTGDPAVLAPRSYFMNDRRYSFVIRGSF